jgi:hypothetical protein
MLFLPLFTSGCDEDIFGHGCTEIGCGDGVHITLHTPEDQWPAGAYAIDFTVDGQEHACELSIPADLPTEAHGYVELGCQPAFDASLTAKTVCTEQRTNDAISQSCQPVAGAWILEASFYGVSEALRVEVRRDDETLLDETMQLEYTASRPNGPDCEPVCEQARVELDIP